MLENEEEGLSSATPIDAHRKDRNDRYRYCTSYRSIHLTTDACWETIWMPTLWYSQKSLMRIHKGNSSNQTDASRVSLLPSCPPLMRFAWIELSHWVSIKKSLYFEWCWTMLNLLYILSYWITFKNVHLSLSLTSCQYSIKGRLC